MKTRLIVSLYFSYVSKSGGVIDFSENLVRSLGRSVSDLIVLRPDHCISNSRLRTLLRFLMDVWVGFRYWSSSAVALFPNYFFLPIPGQRLKNVVVVHDLMFKHYPQYVGAAKRAVLHISYLMVKKWADGVIFISKDSQEDFIKIYGSPKSHTYIYNPVALPEDVWTIERRVGPVGDYAVANFHFYPHKNFPKLLEVFAGLRREWPGLRLVLTGNKPPDLEKLLGEHAGYIDHLGFLPKEQVLALVRDSAFFLSMSQFEGFNMSAAEAAILKRPLVLSDIPVHREIFSRCACLLDLGDSTYNFQNIVDFVKNNDGFDNSSVVQLTSPSSVAANYLKYIEEIGQGKKERILE